MQTQNTKIQLLSSQPVPQALLAAIFNIFNVTMNNIAAGEGAAKTTMCALLLGACRQGICFLPLIFLLPRLWQLNGVIFAQPLADLLAVAIAAAFTGRLHREINRQIQKSLRNHIDSKAS